MTPMLVLLYIASFASILLLAGFARHNRKSGWTKKRNPVYQELLELQQIWEQQDAFSTATWSSQVAQTSPSAPALSAEQFSGQLARLQGALGQKTVKPARAEDRVLA